MSGQPLTELGPPNNYSSVAYEASEVIKASNGIVYRVHGYNSGAAQFIQLHDAASLPADTAIPEVLVAVAGTSNFDIDFGVHGRQFNIGIVITNSTTGPTKTIGAADVYFDVQFE